MIRYEFYFEPEFGGYGADAEMKIAAEYETYQGQPVALYVRGSKIITGKVGRTVEKQWVELKPYGKSMEVGLYHGLIEELAKKDHQKAVADLWVKDEAARIAERNDYRRSKRLPEVAA